MPLKLGFQAKCRHLFIRKEMVASLLISRFMLMWVLIVFLLQDSRAVRFFDRKVSFQLLLILSVLGFWLFKQCIHDSIIYMYC